MEEGSYVECLKVPSLNLHIAENKFEELYISHPGKTRISQCCSLTKHIEQAVYIRYLL